MGIWGSVEHAAKGGAYQGIVTACNDKLREPNLEPTFEQQVRRMRATAISDAAAGGHKIDVNKTSG